jgi:hypothetical protein
MNQQLGPTETASLDVSNPMLVFALHFNSFFDDARLIQLIDE